MTPTEKAGLHAGCNTVTPIDKGCASRATAGASAKEGQAQREPFVTPSSQIIGASDHRRCIGREQAGYQDQDSFEDCGLLSANHQAGGQAADYLFASIE